MGYAAERLMLVEMLLPAASPAAGALHAQFLDRAVAALEAVPAIAGATPVNLGPFSGEGGNYFSTLGIRMVRGRGSRMPIAPALCRWRW